MKRVCVESDTSEVNENVHGSSSSSSHSQANPSKNDDAEVYKRLANHAFEQQQYETAYRYYTNSIVLKKDDPVLYCNRSACLISLQRISEAIADAHAALSIDITVTRAYCRLGKCYMLLGDLNKSNEYYSQGQSIAEGNLSMVGTSKVTSTSSAHRNDQTRLQECVNSIGHIRELEGKFQNLESYLQTPSVSNDIHAIRLLLELRTPCGCCRPLYLTLLGLFMRQRRFSEALDIVSALFPTLSQAILSPTHSLSLRNKIDVSAFSVPVWIIPSQVDSQMMSIYCSLLLFTEQWDAVYALLSLVSSFYGSTSQIPTAPPPSSTPPPPSSTQTTPSQSFSVQSVSSQVRQNLSGDKWLRPYLFLLQLVPMLFEATEHYSGTRYASALTLYTNATPIAESARSAFELTKLSTICFAGPHKPFASNSLAIVDSDAVVYEEVFANVESVLCWSRANCHYRLGFVDKCIVECTRSLALVPSQVRVFRRRARAFAQLSRIAEAVKDYESALGIDPSRVDIRGEMEVLRQKLIQLNTQSSGLYSSVNASSGSRGFGIDSTPSQLNSNSSSSGHFKNVGGTSTSGSVKCAVNNMSSDELPAPETTTASHPSLSSSTSPTHPTPHTAPPSSDHASDFATDHIAEHTEFINPNMTHYEVLCIEQESNDKDIASAYRKLAKLYHPDKNNTDYAKCMFLRVNEAYNVLSDTKKRQLYDFSLVR